MTSVLSPGFEFPPEQQQAQNRAEKLEWVSIFYLTSVVILMYLVMGSSQAMKTAWMEDMLSLIPPIAFLVASKICYRAPSHNFPYGFHRSTMLAFLCAALALFAMGAFLFIDSALKLIKQEHPTIGSIELFGHDLWLGWAMIAVLLYSAIPAVVLGRVKQPLASKIHDKALFSDADMNRADWLTALAAILGVIGIGYGLWWADAVAAIVISVDILRDGYNNVREVTSNLLAERPKTTDRKKFDDLPERVHTYFENLSWVDAVGVRMREEGHVFFGEVFVVAGDESHLTQHIYDAAEGALKLDWRLQDIVISPVPSLDVLPKSE